MQQQTSGIKVAQAGFDVRTCPDYDLLFNSSWPSISIVLDKTLTFTTDQFGDFTLSHNLGFIPLNMAWQFSDSSMSLSLGRIFPNVDKINLYFSDAPNTSYTINFKCYNLDITIPQSYLYLQPPAVNSIYDPTYGIKVVKQNEAISSNDMRSFILHSRTASPQVLAVVTETSVENNLIQFTNPQGYTPWAFGYAQVGDVYVWAPPVSQDYPSLVIQNNVVSMALNTSSGTGKGSIIILRDPLFAPSSVQVEF